MLHDTAGTKTYNFNINLNLNGGTNIYDVLIVLLIIIGVLVYVYLNKKPNVPAQNSRKLSPTKQKGEHEPRRTHTAVPEPHAEEIETLSRGEERSGQPRTCDAEVTCSTTDVASNAPIIIISDEEESESSDDDKIVQFRPPSPWSRIELSPELRRWRQNYFIPPIVEFPPESSAVDVVPVMTSRHDTGTQEVVVRHRRDVARVDEMHANQDEMTQYFKVIGKEMPVDWQQLALSLGVPFAQIQGVRLMYPHSCWMCCQHILHLWKYKYHDGRLATKEDLITAVKETDNQDVATKLESMYPSTQTHSQNMSNHAPHANEDTKEKGQDLEKQTEATVSIKEDERNDGLKFSGKAKEIGQDVAKQTEATGSTKEDETNVPGTKLDDDLELGVSTGISYRDRSRRTPAGEGGKARKDEHDFEKYAMFISAKISFGGKELARLLGLTANEIKYIWAKHSGSRTKCFDVLLQWRNREGAAATMQVLMKALAKVGPFAKAVDDLESKFPELKDIDVSDSDSD
ncbi:uncharacterized protein LOC144867730 [Branchiostoma floridae x Branchiostoma japonicum]